MNREENKSILELKEKLNSPWLFLGLGKERRVNVDKELILDTNLNFINVVTDFYTVETLHKNVGRVLKEKSANRIIGENSNLYGDFLRLKLFYEDELSNNLEILEDVKEEELGFLKESILSIYGYYIYGYYRYRVNWKALFDLYKQTKIKGSLDVIGLTERQNSILRIYLLNYIYSFLFLRTYFYNFPLRYNLEFEDWKNQIEISKRILFEMDNDKMKFESQLLLFNTQGLNRVFISRRKKHLVTRFCKKIEELNLVKFINKEINCYASVRLNNTHYITVNGLNDEDIKATITSIENTSNKQKVVTILVELLGRENIEYVPITEETKYYLKYGKDITYGQFVESKSRENRMFTCCERKLISKIDSIGLGKKITVKLPVTKYPCELCSRAIKITNRKKTGNFKIKIKSPKKDNRGLNKQDINKMDECARMISKKFPKSRKK
ncbi:hypothetical protein DW666_06590 [Streptococcus parasanguinis]|uniref:hypothetical protein n=1 Tax=Streptococcus parasanguinis TaxID=1318 RepID=UPI000E4CBE27|nr:hypothetical protein [Streptococcus parasanguinis]RHF68685.1 hypothetical protein DW666_06590 [Streptococcus parasanguinis]